MCTRSVCKGRGGGLNIIIPPPRLPRLLPTWFYSKLRPWCTYYVAPSSQCSVPIHSLASVMNWRLGCSTRPAENDTILSSSIIQRTRECSRRECIVAVWRPRFRGIFTHTRTHTHAHTHAHTCIMHMYNLIYSVHDTQKVFSEALNPHTRGYPVCTIIRWRGDPAQLHG